MATKVKKNPFVELFLKNHPMWSATSATHGEAAWDAAIDEVLKVLEANDGSPGINHSHTYKAVKALKSTHQRYSR